MIEGVLIILLIIGIVYLRYQDYVLQIWHDPVLMIGLIVVGVILYGIYYLVRHILEKVKNKISMYRAGVKTSFKVFY